jgi:hypothetical protein
MPAGSSATFGWREAKEMRKIACGWVHQLRNLLLPLFFFLLYLFRGLLFFHGLGGFFLGRFFRVLTFTHRFAPLSNNGQPVFLNLMN